MTANTQPARPRIVYYGGGWPTNIGNAFIDLGAMALLREAVPGGEIHFASEMPRWMFGDRHASQALDMAAVSRCDLVAFSGMAMCEEFIRVNGPTILRVRERGIPVLLLGTGGQAYTREERKLYSEFLREVQPAAFVARDAASYEAYSGVVERSVSGIDCGYFVSLAYSPAPVDLDPYVVVNFDRTEAPPLNIEGRTIIYTHHDLWGPIPEARKSRPNTMISDLPHDYLTLYAGAECVYSDRVHACVAALAYGRRAQLFHPTLRGGLFEAIGASSIREAPTTLDPEVLAARRTEQTAVVASLIRECLSEAQTR